MLVLQFLNMYTHMYYITVLTLPLRMIALAKASKYFCLSLRFQPARQRPSAQ